MNIAVYMQAVERAVIKLYRIIAREGDADGARLQPEYLMQLIREELQAMKAEDTYSAENYLIKRVV